MESFKVLRDKKQNKSKSKGTWWSCVVHSRLIYLFILGVVDFDLNKAPALKT
jgi:hypothetical protein